MKIFNDNIPTKELFVFLKYNSIPHEGNELKLNEMDEQLYKQFVSKFNNLIDQFDKNQNTAKTTASSILSMFGFTRHYCSMTGQPIIGQYFKINGKIVSKEAYDAHKIIQEIEGKI